MLKFDIYIDIYILENRHLHFGKSKFTLTFTVNSGWVKSDICIGEFDIKPSPEHVRVVLVPVGRRLQAVAVVRESIGFRLKVSA